MTPEQLDAADPLARFREQFDLPPGVIYLDGNSLGPLPKRTPEVLEEVVRRQWGRDLIASWNSADWIGAPARVGGKIARLIGAKAGEVIVADSVSVNLFKLLGAALKARPGRRVVLTEPGNFPTDLYVAGGIAGLVPGVEVRTAPADGIEAALDEDVAVLLLTHVHYKSSFRYGMARITEAAQRRGALVLWDLSHSVGAVEVDMGACSVDLAVGCGYKYLNGGPGAPAFLYVAERHQEGMIPPLTGWMGHAAPFAFTDDYQPARGVERFLVGTPPILSLAALEVGVDLMLEADMREVEAKARGLNALLIELVEERCPELRLASPRDPERRGSHVSFAHPNAYALCQALIARGVVGDFRAPDILRLGLTPLTLRYADVAAAVEVMADVLRRGLWREPRYAVRARVT